MRRTAGYILTTTRDALYRTGDWAILGLAHARTTDAPGISLTGGHSADFLACLQGHRPEATGHQSHSKFILEVVVDFSIFIRFHFSRDG